MLNWIAIFGGQYLVELGGPMQGTNALLPTLRRGRRLGQALGLLGPLPRAPRRDLHRDRRARRLLPHSQPDDSRVRDPRGRLQPRGRALQRHPRAQELLPRACDRGRRSPEWQERSTCSATSTRSTRATSPTGVAFTGIAVALLGRNKPVGIFFAALLFAGLQVGTSSRHLDPEVFEPALASDLSTMIQALVIFFVGADLLIIYIWRAAPPSQAAARRRTRSRSVVIDRYRNPRTVGIVGIALGVLAFLLTMPPFTIRAIVVPIVVGLAAMALGLAALSQGETRLGGFAIAFGFLGGLGGLWAQGVDEATLEGRADGRAAGLDAAFRDAACVRGDGRHLLRALRRREHRARGDDARRRVLRRLGVDLERHLGRRAADGDALRRAARARPRRSSRSTCAPTRSSAASPSTCSRSASPATSSAPSTRAGSRTAEVSRVPTLGLGFLDHIPGIGSFLHDVFGGLSLLVWLMFLAVVALVRRPVQDADRAADPLGRRASARRGHRRDLGLRRALCGGHDLGRAGRARRRVPLDRVHRHRSPRT